MNVRTIRLVYSRELRDQLRDRRTLFTVLILPILIYPLLGLAMWQVAQLSSPEECRIWLVGADYLPRETPLTDGDRFASSWLDEPERRITEVFVSGSNAKETHGPLRQYWENSQASLSPQTIDWLRQQLVLREYDLAIVVPAARSPTDTSSLAQIQIVQNSSRSSSVAAADRAKTAIQNWTRRLVADNLDARQIQVGELKPFELGVVDVAHPGAASALKWSKTLPLLFVIWALTGAFYPAVDLCAGEKERGTLETLLSSPAARVDIIGGKLLTVMTFSVITAVLNLLSLGISATFVLGTSANHSPLGQAIGLSLPPLYIVPILLAGLIPIAALFSALAFAVAAFARSSKEGQYYLMPLLMVSFPLLILPMLPGIELAMGTSLIPVSGLILLMHSLIEGNSDAFAMYFGPVTAVTLICCGLAIKWSVHQFNDETILFRTTDPVSLGTWLKHLWCSRGPHPTLALAVFCAAAILIAKFFSTFAVSPPSGVDEMWRQAIGLLIVAVALPAIGFAFLTTRRPWQSLGARVPAVWTVIAAGLLAIFLHPLFTCLSEWVITLFPLPVSPNSADGFFALLSASETQFGMTILVLCIAPAVCEELAFRGFILSGLRSAAGPVSAVIACSMLFGLAHSVIQQSIITFFVGLALGFVAIRSGSIFPCMTFHAIHNTLTIGLSRLDESVIGSSKWLNQLMLVDQGQFAGYQSWAVVVGGLFAVVLVIILLRNPVTVGMTAEARAWTRSPSPSA